MAGVPKEQLMAQLGPFLGSAISTVTQTYEKKMQVLRPAHSITVCLAAVLCVSVCSNAACCRMVPLLC